MAPPGPSPGSATDIVSKSIYLLYFIAVITVDLHCGFGCCALVLLLLLLFFLVYGMGLWAPCSTLLLKPGLAKVEYKDPSGVS